MPGPTLLSQLSGAIADVAAAAAPSIVEVASHRSLASGFVWRDGLIVTPDETLADEGEVLVELSDGTQHPVSVVGRDPATDIALLRLEGVKAPPAAFADDAPRPGALVVVAGAAESAPLVSLASATFVGPAWRSIRGGKIDSRIELSGRLRRRAEGGLALSAEGAAIGMAVRGPRGRTLVIPRATIERVAPLLLEHGEVPRGYLGLALKDVALSEGGRGAMVMSLDSNGPASAGGILQGDIILKWNGEPVTSANALVRALDDQSIGEVVPVSIRRGGQDVEASLTVAKRARG